MNPEKVITESAGKTIEHHISLGPAWFAQPGKCANVADDVCEDNGGSKIAWARLGPTSCSYSSSIYEWIVAPDPKTSKYKSPRLSIATVCRSWTATGADVPNAMYIEAAWNGDVHTCDPQRRHPSVNFTVVWRGAPGEMWACVDIPAPPNAKPNSTIAGATTDVHVLIFTLGNPPCDGTINPTGGTINPTDHTWIWLALGAAACAAVCFIVVWRQMRARAGARPETELRALRTARDQA